MIRSYSRDPRRDAAEIAREVVLDGRSDGWSGEHADLEAVAAVLAPFGIVYVDDMLGRWTSRKAAQS